MTAKQEFYKWEKIFTGKGLLSYGIKVRIKNETNSGGTAGGDPCITQLKIIEQ